MSSNIQVQRICQHCDKEFTARTTVTKYCGDDCAKRAYKVRMRVEKIKASDQETKSFIVKPIEELKAKEFLTVRETAKLLNSSRHTIYTLIKSGKIKAVNLKAKKTIIQRSDINKLFEA